MPSRKTRRPAGRGERPNLVQEIADRITAALQKAIDTGEKIPPWRKPWKTSNIGFGLPMRMSDGRSPYRGINIVLLWIAAQEEGYSSQWWGTYDQIAKLA